jgi:hypothetical protein
MTRRSQSGARAPLSLPAVTAGHVLGTPTRAAPDSNSETAMNLMSDEMARCHQQQRAREAEQWRMRRAALAARRAEAAARRVQAAERRARLAREAALLAVRDSALVAAR